MNFYTDEHGRRFQYRLTENVYAQDESGAWRLTERVPVADDAFMTDGEELWLARPDGTYIAAWFLLEGECPKYTLTEVPMHTNCAPCEAGLPEETHAAPETALKTMAKVILMVLAVATAAAFMQWCG